MRATNRRTAARTGAARSGGLAAAVLLLGPLAAGCGGDDPAGSEPPGGERTAPRALDPEALATIERAEARLQRYCGIAARAAARAEAPPAAARRRAVAAVEVLLAIARADPRARVERGIDAGLRIGDIAEDLEGSGCDRALVSRLTVGLAGL